jgi:hypothetical protein
MINHPAPGTAGSTAAAGVGGSESDAGAATVTDRDRDRDRDLPLAVGRASDYLRDRRRTVIMTAGRHRGGGCPSPASHGAASCQ